MVVQLEQRDEVDRVLVFGWLKSGFIRRWNAVIPRANVLTDVTAEQPVSDALAQFLRKAVTQLDGQITDTTAGIEDVRLWKGVCGASVKTRSASATVVGRKRLIVVQHNIGQHGCQEKLAAKLLVEQQCVFAEPP